MKRAVIIEDQILMRDLLAYLLVNELHYDEAPAFEDGEKGLEAVVKLVPQLVVLDLVLPRLGGLSVLRQIKQRCPGIPVFVVSSTLTPAITKAVSDSGVNGICTKDYPLDNLREAIRQVETGAVFFCPASYALLRQNQFGEDGGGPALTAREMDILQLVGEGYSSKEIAGLLSVSVRTVEAHRGNIMKKHDLRGATDMVRLAMRMSLVSA